MIDIAYINIGMPCDTGPCKTNKNTWFHMTQTRDTPTGKELRSVMICDDCLFEYQKDAGVNVYTKMVEYIKQMNFSFPDDWIPYEKRMKELEGLSNIGMKLRGET